MISDLRNFDETTVDIVGKDWKDEDVYAVWVKGMDIVQRQEEYWRPYLERGKTCNDFYRGEIFDDETRSVYENVEDKYVIEPRKLKTAINSLVGQMMQAQKGGKVTVESGTVEQPNARADEVAVINVVLKHMERRWGEKHLLNELLNDAMRSTYPVWIWFERVGQTEIAEYGEYKPTVLAWDSTYVSPFHYRSAVGDDVIGMTRFQYMTAEELIDIYPEQKDVIIDYMSEIRGRLKENTLNFDHIDNWEISFNSDRRDRIIFDATSGINTLVAPDGYFAVYERNYPIITKETVCLDVFNPKNYEIKPPEWEEERWQEFIKEKQKTENTEYVETEREVRTLFTTVFTSTGLVLYHGKSWYQENGQLPGVMLVPSIIDGSPEGPAADMLSDTLAYAVAQTEHLDDMRKNTGSVTVARDGAIANVENIEEELNKTHGYIAIKKEAPVFANSIMEWKRTASKGWLEYSQMRENELEKSTMISRTMQGAPQNKSGKAQQVEIERGLITQSIYISNWNRYIEKWHNLKLAVMPYIYNRYDVLEINDDDGKTLQVEVNAPQTENDGSEKIVNDLGAKNYRWVMTQSDDSATAKEEEYNQALIFLNSVPGPIVNADPTGQLLAKFMMSMDNRYLNSAGKALMKDAEQKMQAQQQQAQQTQQAEHTENMAKLKLEAERNKKQGISLSLTGDQLAEYPNLGEWLASVGFITPINRQNEMNQQNRVLQS